jgi:hypothetical protein
LIQCFKIIRVTRERGRGGRKERKKERKKDGRKTERKRENRKYLAFTHFHETFLKNNV